MNGSRAAVHLPEKTPLVAFADLTNGVTVSRFETTPTRQTQHRRNERRRPPGAEVFDSGDEQRAALPKFTDDSRP